ncbi:hypothetical protein [Halorubrum sp. DTA98]|uniref:hypothetical protein n=1 Tax=Halorubrum sp. DTA98 TaxID=3402163 RepID=UPI003AACDEFC
MNRMSLDDWERLAPDPDPVRDLGYAESEWSVSETDQYGHRHVVFVSNREEDRDREAFIIADDDAVRDLIDVR